MGPESANQGNYRPLSSVAQACRRLRLPLHMDSGTSPDSVEAVTVPLRVVHAASIDVVRAIAVLDDLSWFGPLTEGSREGLAYRRVVVDLALPIFDGSAPGPVYKAAFIDLGPTEPVDDGLGLDIEWRSASLAPLFPVFVGRLQVRTIGLILDGRYAPPFGKLGLVIDRSLLHFVAQRTAVALLARLAGQFAS